MRWCEAEPKAASPPMLQNVASCGLASELQSRLARATMAPLTKIGHAWILTLAISLRVSPLISFAPATITVEVRAPLAASDRKIVVLLDGEHYGTSDERTVDPEHPLPVYRFEFKRVPEGRYEVTAQIGSWQSVRAEDRTTIAVN